MYTGCSLKKTFDNFSCLLFAFNPSGENILVTVLCCTLLNECDWLVFWSTRIFFVDCCFGEQGTPGIESGGTMGHSGTTSIRVG